MTNPSVRSLLSHRRGAVQKPEMSAFGGHCGILPGGENARDVNDLATV